MSEPITYPIKHYDANGNKTYFEDSKGNWWKYEYDTNRNETYYENSKGNWEKAEYDANGNETYFEDSYGIVRGVKTLDVEEDNIKDVLKQVIDLLVKLQTKLG
jgi:uncharacterized protein RhaS with RHS repeats